MKEARDQAMWIEKETAAYESERLSAEDKVCRDWQAIVRTLNFILREQRSH